MMIREKILKINLIFVIFFLSFFLSNLIPINYEETASYTKREYLWDFKNNKTHVNVLDRDTDEVTEYYTYVINTHIDQEKNERNKFIINKENYNELAHEFEIELEQQVKKAPTKSIKVKTKDILFFEDNKYVFKYNIINYSNERRLTFLKNNTLIKDNNYYFILAKGEHELKFTFTKSHDEGEKIDTSPNYKEINTQYYISSVFNINFDKLISINAGYDFIGNKLNYTVLNNNYKGNETVANNYNIDLTYYDYTNIYRKTFNIKINSNDKFKKYFITRKELDPKDRYKIYVSNEYLLTEEDFNNIKNVLFEENNNIFLVKETYNEYYSDNYTLGNNYTIEAELINPEKEYSTNVFFDIEIIKNDIFNNSTTKININKFKNILSTVIFYILGLFLIAAIIFIVFKVKRKYKGI